MISLTHELLPNLRYALRRLRRTPGFVLTSISILGLGIGLNTAIFSLTYALLFRDLPVSDPQSLIHIKTAVPGPVFDDLRNAQKTGNSPFTDLFGWYGGLFNAPMEVQDGPSTAELPYALISGEGLSLLGLKPSIGRLLGSFDDQPGGGTEGWNCVLNYGYWKQRYNSSPSVLGHLLILNNNPVKVIGVVPEGFDSLTPGERPSVYLPLEFVDTMGSKSMRHNPRAAWIDVYGRLKRNSTTAQAQSQIDSIMFEALKRRYSDPESARMKAASLVVETGAHGHSWLVNLYRTPLLMLQALGTLCLLLCCISLSGLFSARALAFRRDFILHSVLGANRRQLTVLVLFEILPVLVLGTILAILFSSRLASVVFTNVLSSIQVPLFLDFSPNLSFLAISVTAVFFACMFAWLAPLRAATRVAPAEELKDANAVGLGWRSRRFLGWSIPIQITAATVLVATALLFGATFIRLTTMNLGFRPDGLVIFRIRSLDLPPLAASNQVDEGYKPKDPNIVIAERYAFLLDRLRTMPGVTQVSTSLHAAIEGGSATTEVANTRERAISAPLTAVLDYVAPAYFSTTGTPLLSGREFSNTDQAGGPSTCIVSARASEELFPSGTALGKIVFHSNESEKKITSCQIVGIAADTKLQGMRDQNYTMLYLPWGQSPTLAGASILMVRTDRLDLANSSVRKAIGEIAPGATIAETVLMSDKIRRSIARERVLAILAGLFAALALAITSGGLYGVLAYQIERRSSEIGIRMALGASRRSIVTLFLRKIFRLFVTGSLSGLVIAYAAARYIESLLYGVRADSLWVYCCCFLVILLAVAAGSYVPARRAASIDPMKALRSE